MSVYFDYSPSELAVIAQLLLAGQHYRFSPEAAQALKGYVPERMGQPSTLRWFCAMTRVRP